MISALNIELSPYLFVNKDGRLLTIEATKAEADGNKTLWLIQEWPQYLISRSHPALGVLRLLRNRKEFVADSSSWTSVAAVISSTNICICGTTWCA